jgi:hypothetical protein
LQRFSVVANPATSAMTPFQGSFSTSTSEFPWSTMERKWGRQKWWNDIRQAEDVRRWSSQVDLRRRKLLELGAARHATDIAALFPQAEGAPEFSSRSWVLQARFRLGLPLLPGAVNTALRCPGCSHPQDIYGDHALCCPSLGIYARHNGVRAEVSALCTEVGLTVQHNVHLPGSTDVPADLFIQGMDGSPAVAVDFSCAHALHPSSVLANVCPGHHAKLVEQLKCRRYLSCQRAGWHFVPFVLEVIGSWGGESNWLMQRVITLWASKFQRQRPIAVTGGSSITSRNVPPTRESFSGGILCHLGHFW